MAKIRKRRRIRKNFTHIVLDKTAKKFIKYYVDNSGPRQKILRIYGTN